MYAKSIRLSPKKGGHGHITSYSINIGSAEARECGFLDPDGAALPLKKNVDPENSRIVIELEKEDI